MADRVPGAPPIPGFSDRYDVIEGPVRELFEGAMRRRNPRDWPNGEALFIDIYKLAPPKLQAFMDRKRAAVVAMFDAALLERKSRTAGRRADAKAEREREPTEEEKQEASWMGKPMPWLQARYDRMVELVRESAAADDHTTPTGRKTRIQADRDREIFELAHKAGQWAKGSTDRGGLGHNFGRLNQTAQSLHEGANYLAHMKGQSHGQYQAARRDLLHAVHKLLYAGDTAATAKQAKVPEPQAVDTAAFDLYERVTALEEATMSLAEGRGRVPAHVRRLHTAAQKQWDNQPDAVRDAIFDAIGRAERSPNHVQVWADVHAEVVGKPKPKPAVAADTHLHTVTFPDSLVGTLRSVFRDVGAQLEDVSVKVGIYDRVAYKGSRAEWDKVRTGLSALREDARGSARGSLTAALGRIPSIAKWEEEQERRAARKARKAAERQQLVDEAHKAAQLYTDYLKSQGLPHSGSAAQKISNLRSIADRVTTLHATMNDKKEARRIIAELTELSQPSQLTEAVAIPGRAVAAAERAAARDVKMDLHEAHDWLLESMTMLAALPPPGPGKNKDDIGFSVATNALGRRWLMQEELSGGVHQMDPEKQLAGMEILRVHSQGQLDRDQFDAAYDVIRASTPMDPKKAKASLYWKPGSNKNDGETDKGSAWHFEGKMVGVKTPQKRGSRFLSYKTLAAAGFKVREEVIFKKTGSGEAVWYVAPHVVEQFADYLEEKYPPLAAALRRWAPVWQDETDVQKRAAPAKPAKPAAPAILDLDALNPERGEVEGVMWKWSPRDNRRLMLQFPFKKVAFAVGDVVAAQPAYESTVHGMEYWRAYDSLGARKIAEVVGSDKFKLHRAARALLHLAPAWAQKASLSAEDKELRERRARKLTRRFRHMLHHDLRADSTAAEQAIAEGLDLLDEIKAGDLSADLGAWGRWVVRGDTLYVYQPYNQLEKWWRDLPGAKRTKDSNWHVRVALKKAPALARVLDKYSPPLAMSIRLGLLTEDIGANRNCDLLEELASANEPKDIVDRKAAKFVRDVNQRIRWTRGIKPRPFQQVGIAYAVAAGGRALIGDSMGLGKTMQALGFLLTDIPKHTPALVVAPSSVTYNWVDEIEKFAAGQLKATVIANTRQKLPRHATRGEVFIVSWDMQKRVYERLGAMGFKTLIMDESHYAKNAKSGRSQTALHLAATTPHVLAMSGTAMENRPIELWHQLHMIDQSTFPAQKDFGERYANATKRTVYNKQLGQSVTYMDDRGHSNLDELRDLLRCYMIRRLATDVIKDLPEKTRTARWTNLPPAARRAYDDEQDQMEAVICAAWRKRSIASAKKMIANGASVKEAIHQANAEPPDAKMLAEMAIVRLGYLRRAVARAKVPAAVQWILDFQSVELPNLPGTKGKKAVRKQPLVVFVEHQEVLQALGAALNKAKVRWNYIDGDVPALKRRNIVKDFQNGVIDVLVGTQALHSGVTLTRASNMLFVERWWVPSREEQAEDRIYRIGQENAVTINYLMAHNTVDEHINQLVDDKRQVIQQVMGSNLVNAKAVNDRIAGAQVQSLASALAKRVAAKLQAAGECAITAADLR